MVKFAGQPHKSFNVPRLSSGAHSSFDGGTQDCLYSMRRGPVISERSLCTLQSHAQWLPHGFLKPKRAMDDGASILMVDDQPVKLLSYEAILAEPGENPIKAHSEQKPWNICRN
jgi:hypothetical protein